MNVSANPLDVLKLLSDATSALVSKLSGSIVCVNSRMARGTGVVLSSDNYIVTCNHVLAGCNEVKISQAGKNMEAKIVGTDPYDDLALLRTEKGDFTPIELGDSDRLSTGQFVLAIANSYNRQHLTATTGIITSPDSTIRMWRGTALENVIASDAKLNPGFSGGPLVDAEGRMIGLNTAYVMSRGIAIPANKVKTVAERLMASGVIRRAYLGIATDTVRIPRELIEEEDLDQETAVMVYSVEAGTPARKAGLVMGDVIVKLNGRQVTNIRDLSRLLVEDVIGRETEMIVIRGDRTVTLAVTPSAAKDEDADDE